MKASFAISAVAVLCCTSLIAVSVAGSHASGGSTSKCLERKATVMGLDYYLYLFDLRAYREKVLPAYREFFKNDDTEPLIALMKEIILKLDGDEEMPHPDLWDKDIYDEAIGILNGSVFYSPNPEDMSHAAGKMTTRTAKRVFVRENLGYKIVLALCVPRNKGVNPDQNMGRSSLVPYLYEKSEWIEELFTSVRKVRGGNLEILIGESPSQIFTKQDIEEFSEELARVPPPENSQLRKEYNNLRTMLKLALEDPDLTLLLSLL